MLLSNKHFDPVAGSRLYNEFSKTMSYAEEMGVDGIMLNEHHNAPFCMQAKSNVFASILAGDHETGKNRPARQSVAAVPTTRCGWRKNWR